MGDQIYLTASEARELTMKSTSMRNHVYKAIKERAKECRSQLQWWVDDCSEEIIAKLVDDLTKNGYDVSRDLDDEPNALIITW